MVFSVYLLVGTLLEFFNLFPHFSFHIPFLDALAFIIEFLALCDSDFNLHISSIVQIHLGRNEGIAILGLRFLQGADFSLVEQKSPSPQRISVEDIAHFVRADIHADNKSLSIFDFDIGLANAALARADGFDLRSEELQPRLIGVLYKIIMISLFVLYKYFHSKSLSQICFERIKAMLNSVTDKIQ